MRTSSRSTTSMGATTTWSRTTSSCSAPCPALRARTSASGGEEPVTSSHLGSGACWQTSRSNEPPATTSPASTQPDSRKEASMQDRPSARTLEQRLAEDVILGAEGYVFELERRGYIKAG